MHTSVYDLSYIRHTLLTTLLILSVACGPTLQEGQVKKAEYHHRLAYGHFFESGDSDAALQEAILSLQFNPKVAEVHMLTGLIYTGRSDLLKALKHYRRAIELKPNYYEAKNNLGTVYLSLNMWKKAIEVFSELSQIDEYRTPAMGYNNLGWAYFKLGQFELAKKYFVNATQLNPRLCPPHNNLGLSYIQLKDYERAERSLRAAVKICPQYAEPHLHLGQIHLLQAKSKEALNALDTCRRLAKESEVGIRCAGLIKREKLN